MGYSTLKLAIDTDVAVITLSRAERRNAISPRMIEELADALAAIEAGRARAAVLTGEGAAFCSGMDLEALRQLAAQSPEENLEDSRRMARLFYRLWSFPKPLIAAVNGAAIAGGCGIATLCDFTLAVPEAKFGYTEVRIGFIPALVSVFLERQVGEKKARELLLTGRLIDASEACVLGIVTRVVPAEQLLAAAQGLAADLIANSPVALAATKRLLITGAEAEVNRRLELAIAENAAIRQTADFREGLAAFLGKRKPQWPGR
jgi:methylglutaconyl-CoA hydratase